MKKFLTISGILFLALAGCTAANQTANPTQNQSTGSTNTVSNQRTNSSTQSTSLTVNPPMNAPAITQPVSPQTATQTYKNLAFNFKFDYPAEFNSVTANYGNLDKKIVQEELPSSAYPKTNFDDAAFTVSEVTAKTDTDCLKMNLPEGSNGFNDVATINGVKFYKTTGQGAGAGNFYDSKTYRTFVAPSCYELNETIHTSNIGNFGPGTVTEIKTDPIWQKLDAILNTFAFTN